ncbi:spore coat U domain-containing protein [Sphingobium chlorophenolicum]|uniref:Putative secreted pili protein n=1 Tax=Sphingobium chlorophenolicum TaxID=46429 RepID=A0A081RBW0_SPHCR|nr:spore coat U domain-containing protein [Sphingobium chlorophenolicum]KEQ52683.1 putative secreted pili protein [Sphingobium chlorophenolicum]
MKPVGYMLAALAAMAVATPARACTLCTCSASTTGISFGGYDPTSPVPKDGAGSVTLSCTGLVSLAGTIDIAISPGSSGDALARRMTQGGAALNYNLYTSASRTTVWGTGSGGTGIVSAPLNGLLSFSQTVQVYGQIPAGQWPQAGPYSDSVIVTITY